MSTRGYCFCKNISWEFEGDTTWACYCHCDDCRRNCAAPVVAWLGVPLKNFKWLGPSPSTYATPDGVRRHFCGNCGSPIGFEADHYPGGMSLYAASLEHPERFTPEFHVNHQSKLCWLHLEDTLPKHDGTLLQRTSLITHKNL